MVLPVDSGWVGRHYRLDNREGQRQAKTEIRGNTRHNLAFDLCPTGIVGFDGIIPIRVAKLDRVHSFVNGIAECQSNLRIRHRWRAWVIALTKARTPDLSRWAAHFCLADLPGSVWSGLKVDHFHRDNF